MRAGSAEPESSPAHSSQAASSDSPSGAHGGSGPRKKTTRRLPPRKSPSVPIVIVDANPLFRAGLVITLSERRFRVIAASSSLEDLAEGVVERCRLVLISFKKNDQAVLSYVGSLAERGVHVVI